MQGMFSNAPVFNQNLSSWNVDNVNNCTAFSSGASSWTLPQPNFTT
jgi:surface protein